MSVQGRQPRGRAMIPTWMIRREAVKLSSELKFIRSRIVRREITKKEAKRDGKRAIYAEFDRALSISQIQSRKATGKRVTLSPDDLRRLEDDRDAFIRDWNHIVEDL